jgi:hypothetical protein
MAWHGFYAIGIVKLPFTLLSMVSTLIEIALVYLMRTVIGWLGSEDDVETFNEVMDAAGESSESVAELYEYMKL